MNRNYIPIQLDTIKSAFAEISSNLKQNTSGVNYKSFKLPDIPNIGGLELQRIDNTVKDEIIKDAINMTNSTKIGSFVNILISGDPAMINQPGFKNSFLRTINSSITALNETDPEYVGIFPGNNEKMYNITPLGRIFTVLHSNEATMKDKDAYMVSLFALMNIARIKANEYEHILSDKYLTEFNTHVKAIQKAKTLNELEDVILTHSSITTIIVVMPVDESESPHGYTQDKKDKTKATTVTILDVRGDLKNDLIAKNLMIDSIRKDTDKNTQTDDIGRSNSHSKLLDIDIMNIHDTYLIQESEHTNQSEKNQDGALSLVNENNAKINAAVSKIQARFRGNQSRYNTLIKTLKAAYPDKQTRYAMVDSDGTLKRMNTSAELGENLFAMSIMNAVGDDQSEEYVTVNNRFNTTSDIIANPYTIKEEDIVEAKFRGDTRLNAKVINVRKGNTYDLNFIIDRKGGTYLEREVPVDRITIKAGDIVNANHPDNNELKNARVEKIHEDGTYDVVFEVGNGEVDFAKTKYLLTRDKIHLSSGGRGRSKKVHRKRFYGGDPQDSDRLIVGYYINKGINKGQNNYHVTFIIYPSVLEFWLQHEMIYTKLNGQIQITASVDLKRLLKIPGLFPIDYSISSLGRDPRTGSENLSDNEDPSISDIEDPSISDIEDPSIKRHKSGVPLAESVKDQLSESNIDRINASRKSTSRNPFVQNSDNPSFTGNQNPEIASDVLKGFQGDLPVHDAITVFSNIKNKPEPIVKSIYESAHKLLPSVSNELFYMISELPNERIKHYVDTLLPKGKGLLGNRDPYYYSTYIKSPKFIQALKAAYPNDEFVKKLGLTGGRHTRRRHSIGKSRRSTRKHAIPEKKSRRSKKHQKKMRHRGKKTR